MRAAGAALAVIAAGCARAEPAQLAEGTFIAAFVNFQEQQTAGGSTLEVSATFRGMEAGPPLEWDHCDTHDGGGGVGGAAIIRDVGEPWIAIDGDRVALHPDTADGAQWSGDVTGTDPHGAWLGGGTSGGEDRDAFQVEHGVRIPEGLEFRTPELDAGVVVDRDEPLAVRWRRSSRGFVALTLSDDVVVIQCIALDDGRFDIPARWLRDLNGPGLLAGTRVVREDHELPNGDFVAFTAYHSAFGTLSFGR